MVAMIWISSSKTWRQVIFVPLTRWAPQEEIDPPKTHINRPSWLVIWFHRITRNSLWELQETFHTCKWERSLFCFVLTNALTSTLDIVWPSCLACFGRLNIPRIVSLFDQNFLVTFSEVDYTIWLGVKPLLWPRLMLLFDQYFSLWKEAKICKIRWPSLFEVLSLF